MNRSLFLRTPAVSVLCKLAWIAVGTCLIRSLASAHPDTQIQIPEVTRQLAAQGASPNLYLFRAGLYLEHESFELALEDYRAFSKARPGQAAGSFGEARVLISMGKITEAAVVVEQHLKRFPQDGNAHMLRADIAVAQKNPSAAIEACKAAINSRPSPVCEDYKRLIQLQAAIPATGLATARNALAQARENLFPNRLDLLELEISLAESASDWPAAVAGIDKLMAPLRRKEVLLVRKGTLFEKAGDNAAAVAAYQQALAAVAALPDFLQGQQHAQSLVTASQTAILRLAKPTPGIPTLSNTK